MKKIVCELCEGTDFVKDGGMFVCQGCGTKYTAEEARGMMREVDGAVPIVGDVSTPIGNPNQHQIDNLLLLATNAFSANNNEETEKYCNKVIEYDAMCYKAWFLKAKAVGWSSTIKNPRIAEAAHSFKQAVDFAPDDEKESLTEEAVEELERLGLACVALRQKRFSQYPDKEELNGFLSDIEVLVDGLVVLLSKGAEVAVSNEIMSILGPLGQSIASVKFIGLKMKALNAGVPKDYFSKIAVMMGNAAIEGYKTTTNKYNSDDRPMQNDFKKTLTEVDNCIMLLDIASDASDDDDADDISRIESKIAMTEYTINMAAYADYSSSYKDWMLADSSKQGRRKNIEGYKKKIQEIKDKAKAKAEEERKKAEEEKQARIKAYWEAHADEKVKLDAERKELSDKKSRLSTEIADLTKQIDAVQPTENVPSEDESNKVKAQIKELENQKAGLGFFAGKEKKRIGEEIASLQGRVDSLKSKIEEERNARSAETDKKVAPLKAKKDELEKQVSAVDKRLSAVEAELTKDPEK